jgi:hypothetical protein
MTKLKMRHSLKRSSVGGLLLLLGLLLILARLLLQPVPPTPETSHAQMGNPHSPLTVASLDGTKKCHLDTSRSKDLVNTLLQQRVHSNKSKSAFALWPPSSFSNNQQTHCFQVYVLSIEKEPESNATQTPKFKDIPGYPKDSFLIEAIGHDFGYSVNQRISPLEQQAFKELGSFQDPQDAQRTWNARAYAVSIVLHDSDSYSLHGTLECTYFDYFFF